MQSITHTIFYLIFVKKAIVVCLWEVSKSKEFFCIIYTKIPFGIFVVKNEE